MSIFAVFNVFNKDQIRTSTYSLEDLVGGTFVIEKFENEDGVIYYAIDQSDGTVYVLGRTIKPFSC